jgi:hypothetical protein
MSTITVYPDVEGAVKAWLPTVPEVAAMIGDRVFFSVPDVPTWPLVVVTQVAFGPDGTETPTSTPWLQFDCWAEPTPSATKLRKKQASDLALVVCGALDSLRCGTVVNSTRFLWARALSSLPEPNPATNQARYVVTAEVSATAA